MELVSDVRHALRSLAKAPAFALVTIATLALGIGANTAIFSIVHGVLLRDLPYDAPERIAVVWRTTPNAAENPHAAADFLDLRRDQRSFERLAGVRPFDLELSGSGEPRRLDGAEVTAEFFEVFGVGARLGRAFDSATDRPGDRLLVLSAGAFRDMLGADASLVGRALRVSGQQATLVGVMPDGFAWPPEARAWRLSDKPVPNSPVDVPDLLTQRGLSYFDVVARLRPGVALGAAQGELDAIGARLAKEFPDNNTGRGYRVVPLARQLAAPVRAPLLMLFAIVGLVLLIAAANVANLLLARGLGRRRELSVRAALGASPRRLARQLLVESCVLGVLGGAAGVLLAAVLTPALLRLVPGDLPRAGEIGVSLPVLLFALGVSFATGLLFGVAPAVEAARVDAVAGLQSGGRALTGSGRRLREALVAVEIAVAVVVLASGGLLLRSFARLQAVDGGFASESVVTVPLPLSKSRYPGPGERTRFYDGVIEELSRSGRYRVAAGFPAPFGPGTASAAPVRRTDRPPDPNPDMTLFATATPGYFEVMGIPLLRGRAFAREDVHDALKVVVVSRLLAERVWPGENALGAQVTLGGDEPFTVVGVVGDIRRKGLDTAPEPVVYIPAAQFSLPLMHLVLRGGDPAAIASDLRAAVRKLDPELPLEQPETLVAARARSLAQPRFRTTLLGGFGALAALLAALGLYGLVSDGVSRRTREIGIRMALGAQARAVLRLVVRDGLRPVLVGGGLGLLLALAASRTLAAFLYGVTPRDPVTLAVTMALLSLVALAACLPPALRAARLDPAEVMRAE
jgi:putative ABC transport system permease protein